MDLLTHLTLVYLKLSTVNAVKLEISKTIISAHYVRFILSPAEDYLFEFLPITLLLVPGRP